MVYSLPHWFPPLLAFCVSMIGLQLLVRLRLGLDHPNARSLHEIPVPRTGGIALLAGAFAGWAMYPVAPPVMAGAGLLLALSFVDDIRGVHAFTRLILHFAVAVVCVGTQLWSEIGLVGILVATFAVVWGANLYNFMDGADGLAGGMTLIGFAFYGLAALAGGEFAMANLSFSIAAASGAFLLLNFHPAKLFMGDAGSVPLGFIAGTIGLWGWQRGIWALWFPFLVFSPFVMDASVTLVKRAFRRESIWQAHREHCYQRLVLMGWGHRKLALWAYGLMLLAGFAAYWGLGLGIMEQVGLIAISATIYGLLMISIDRRWTRHLLNDGRC